VLAWRLSNTMDVSFCLSALEEALARFGKPEIFNTDQGSQFTSIAFTGALAQAGVAISMDGCGRWMDNRAAVAVDEVRGHLSQKATPTAAKPRAGSPNGPPSTTSGVRTRRSPTARRWRSGAKRSPAPRLWT